MPPSVRVFLVILLLAASVLCVGVPLLLQYRRMHLDPAHVGSGQVSREEICGTVLGLLFVDLLLYSLYRSTLPKSFFYPLLFGLNLLCLLFACRNVVVGWLDERIVRQRPLTEEEELIVERQPTHV